MAWLISKTQDHFSYNILRIRYNRQPRVTEICPTKITSETNDKDDFYYRRFYRHWPGYGYIILKKRLEGDRYDAQS